MIAYARAMNPLGEMWYVDVGDPSGGQKAAGAITINGTATAAGALVRYIGGERYQVGVGVNDTKTTIAAALAAKINAGYVKFGRRLGAPVVATIDGTDTGKIILTARHTGAEANDLRIEAGLDGDEVDPAGLTVTITAMTGGSGLPDMASVLACLGNRPADFITTPYSSVSDLNAAGDFLSDTGTGRAAPLVGLDGHYITVKNGTLSTLTAFGVTRNDRHATVLGINQVPTAPWCIAGALGGAIAFYKNLGRELKTAIEIARPMQTIVLVGVRPPKDPAAVFGIADRDSLYRNGISALVFTASGDAALDRVVTTYRTNAAGLPDTTFLDIEKVMISVYVKRHMKAKLLGTYPRHVLREDNPNSIQGVATPPQLRATVIHGYVELSNIAGVVRQPDLFAANLVVDPDYDNDRVNFYLPASAAAALRVFAVNETIFTNLTAANASGL
ncbi:hypothetical protein [Methylobacterium nodulans]|nr:hypothetical protein [Methylobacterium nodulans]